MQKQNPKQRIERIRGEKLLVFERREYENSLSFIKAFERANKEKRVIVSNKRMDKALHSGEWEQVKEGLWCYTGTLAAYPEPNKKLGSAIEYIDPKTNQRWVFPVPKEHQDKENAILVAEHPNYSLEINGKNIVIHAENPGIVRAFPSQDGWHLVDSKYGIPYGKEVSKDNKDARYLWRTGKMICPVARYHVEFGYYGGHVVGIDFSSSGSYGMIVEAP
ncbi:hypothetical protein KAW38_00295 [Candidatus Micrarchaeota archaeon]|nr:hypothetical protein [Candidatus Micrarchaeota archaeon]